MLDNQKINSANIPQVGSLENKENISTEPSQQFLVFKIDNEEYALDVLSIESIVSVTNITPFPARPVRLPGRCAPFPGVPAWLFSFAPPPLPACFSWY